MQQYRVNLPLLIGLVIGTLVFAGAIYGFHAFQISRQAVWLIGQAEKSAAEKDYRNAVQFYEQYLSIHREDKDTKIKYGNAYLDLDDQDDVLPEELLQSWQVLEVMLRNPDNADAVGVNDLRRRLIKLYGREGIRQYSKGLLHIDLLLKSEPNNVELQVLRANYLSKSNDLEEFVNYSYKLIGYDPKKGTFDLKKATAPHSPQVYFDLANVLRTQQKKPDVAEKIANRMIEANPKSAEAFVDRARLRLGSGDLTGARSDTQQALTLDPKNSDVLMLASDLAAVDKDYDKARNYLKTAKELHPKDVRLYQRAADLEIRQNKHEKAMAELDAGAKAIGGNAATSLLFLKTKLQLDNGDVKGARQTIDDMQRNRKFNSELSEYFEALILVAQGDWLHASEALSKLRPRMTGTGRDMTEIDYDLAMCYERLGQFELAQQKYEQILQQFPQNAPALAGVQRTKGARGLEPGERATDPLQKMVNDELKKPKQEQNWGAVDAMVDENAKKLGLDPTYVSLTKFKIAMIRGDLDAAAKHLLQADKLSPHNLQISHYKIQLARVNPKIGAAKAMEYVNKLMASDQFGDVPSLRLEKAENLIALNKDKQDKGPLKQELAQLLTGIDKWTVQQKVDLWKGMFRGYLALNMMDEARQCLALAADNQPHELPLRIDLFSLALEANDQDGMKAAEDKILQVVGDKNDSNWLYAEARRQLWLLRRGHLPNEALADIRNLVKRAMSQRPDWSELYALMGDVELMSNNPALALKNYDRAEELGRPNAMTVAQHIRLLADSGRYPEAGKLLDRIPEALRQPYLGPYYAEVLFRTKQVAAALQQARAATEADPSNARNHYWYSTLLVRSAQEPDLKEDRRKEIIGQAIESMQKATQLLPEYPDAWFSIINFQMMLDRKNDANKTMREAQLVLSGDHLNMFLARSYESLSRWFDAETMYREIYETNPNDLQRAQQLAAFYMGPFYPRPDGREKATPLINQLLKAGAEGKIPENDGNLLWARRTAARILATTGDYQNLRKAEKLLASNSRDGSLLIQDKLSLADILARRPDPVSRQRALALLEEVSQVQRLGEDQQITRAELYFTSTSGRDWLKYASEMDKVLAQFPNSVRGLESYARRIIERNDPRLFDRAGQLVDKLNSIAPQYPPTFELTVRLADKLGKQQKVLAEMRRRIPNIKGIKEFDEANKQSVMLFANLLADLNDLDSAEQVYREMAARDPMMEFNLAKFIGEHRSPEQCFQKLKELYSVEKLPHILGVALAVAREKRDKIGDKFDAQIQGWIDAGLRENPGSSSMLLVQADLYDLQKRYDDAAKVYRQLLSNKDLVGMGRAIVLNNLAFIIALAGPSAAADTDPLDLIQQAIEILGPNADMLDTRAVIHLARHEYKEAIADLTLSVTDKPTASKYFHKAVAHLGAGEARAALEAWQKAEGLGLNRDAINRMEFDLYEKTKAQIEKIRGPSVTKADSTRKAG
jgi:cellulose synthase operon protein C